MGLRTNLRRWVTRDVQSQVSALADALEQFRQAPGQFDRLSDDLRQTREQLSAVEQAYRALEERCRLEVTEVRAKLRMHDLFSRGIELIMMVAPDTLAELYPKLRHSKAQNLQDIFALAQTGAKRNGYFVEFGACDGVTLSNTYLLETLYDWKGIISEPAKIWHDALEKNRRCRIEHQCVWDKTGATLPFQETDIPELSALSIYSDQDFHAQAREHSKVYEVTTISLNDLLDKYDAPSEMEFLSIDTEGSEYDILKSLNFSKYRFKVITCEHNYTPKREEIFALLQANGYERRYEFFSEWDDWFVHIG